jgi:hypothetical protein
MEIYFVSGCSLITLNTHYFTHVFRFTGKRNEQFYSLESSTKLLTKKHPPYLVET